MKKLLLLIPIIILSCSGSSDDDNKLCTETWQVMEYCTRTSNCPVGGCGETPFTLERTFKCDEVSGIKEGQTVLYKTESSCAKFYRQYIKKIN